MSTLTVALIQADLYWEDKAANLAMLEEKIMGIAGAVELVVLPEMFSTGFSMNPAALAETMQGESLAWMKRVAQQKRCILTGSLIIEEDGHYFNRLIWMLPNGEYGTYDKRHLFAFAGEDAHYAAGNKRLIASVKGWRVCTLICYDLRFPVWARQAPASADDAAEYDLLLYVANWPERRIHAWKTLLQARAIENQCYVIGVNRVGKDGNGHTYSGDSMLVSPMGEVLLTQKDEAAVMTTTLVKEELLSLREKLPFLKDADQFHILPE
jgi:omega-amidase